jgi:hypothetical protein
MKRNWKLVDVLSDLIASRHKKTGLYGSLLGEQLLPIT